MNNITDACYELLGIPPVEQPASHYRLLGLSSFESNRQVISNAADRRMAFVRQLASGPFSKLTQEVLNLLSEAKICLLNEVRREQYDKELAYQKEQSDSVASNLTYHRDSTTPTGKAKQESLELYLPDAKIGTVNDLLEAAIDSLCKSNQPRNVTLSELDEDDASQSNLDQQWLIGAVESCDIVINSPYVSGEHCRLTRLVQGFLIQDLDSRNGTFVNGERIIKSATVTLEDNISLGKNTKFPWPGIAVAIEKKTDARILCVGRNAGNDIVIQDSTVSQHHAEIRISNEGVMLSDLGSLNGTFLNASQQRIENALLSGEGEVRFGRFRMPVALLLAQ